MKNIQVSVINIHRVEVAKEYAKEKMARLDKFINPQDEGVSMDIRISKTTDHHRSGKIYKAEASVMTSGKKFGAEVEADDLFVAIDELKDILSRKMSSYKGKKKGLFKKGAQKIKRLLKMDVNNSDD